MNAPVPPPAAGKVLAGDHVAAGRPGSGVGQLLREITSGGIVGFIALPFCVSAGVVAYGPLGPDHVAMGAAAGILSAVAGGVTGALARSSSFVPNSTSTSMALVQASFLGWLLGRLGGDGALALAVLPLTAILAGIWQALIALSGLGRAVKFTPYPVLAGFVTGLAVLILGQQLPRLVDGPLLAELWRSGHLDPAILPLPLFGIGLAGLILAVEQRYPRAPALLVGLVAGTGLFHAARYAFPDIHLGGTVGQISIAQASLGLELRLLAGAGALADPEILKSLLLTSLTLALLGTLDLTFAVRAAQDMGDGQAAPRRDLGGQGLANVAAALAGGLTITTSLSFARTIFGGGGRTRLSAVSVALVLLLVAALAPRLIALLPTIVLSGILVSIAFRLWDRWCLTLLRDVVNVRDREAHVRARRNIAIVLAVAVTTVLGQPVAGALLGVLLSCLIFIVEMSRPVVRRELDGSQTFSKRIRSQADQALLRGSGRYTAVLELQGILFFGNADDLASRVKRLEGRARIVILDFRRVTDLDTSGATILRQIAARCREHRMRLVFASVDPKLAGLVKGAAGEPEGALLPPDLDAALEGAEDLALASAHAAGGTWRALKVEETDLAGGLSEGELSDLKARLVPCRYPAGASLCRAGEQADRLWLLTRGSVSIRLSGTRADRRIAGLGPGTSVGEMGLLDRRPRSADVVAAADGEGWVLTAAEFGRLLRETPRLGQSLLATIARITAQRLRVTSEELMLRDACPC